MTQEPLRVSFVIQKLFGLSGGAERVFLQTAHAMAKRGMDVDILVYDNGSGAPAYGTDDILVTNLFPRAKPTGHRAAPRGNKTPAILKRMPHGWGTGYVKWALTHGLFAQRLRHALRQNRPDIVVAFLPPAITAAVACGQRLGIPVIASTHNLPEMDFGDSSRWDQNPIYRTRARARVVQADAITVLQSDFRDWFPAQTQDKVHVIANPISRLSAASTPPAVRENLVLGVGRLTDVKRFDLLIAAWARMAPHYPDWRVDIYGEGPVHGALSAQIAAARLQTSVRLCGTTRDIGPVYDRARILCHPAAFEGFGLSVAEAMAHGTPAVAFADCAGVNQLIRSGQNGMLIPSTTDPVQGLVDALTYCVKAPEILHSMGQAAQDICQQYGPDTIALKWDHLIRRLVTQYRKTSG